MKSCIWDFNLAADQSGAMKHRSKSATDERGYNDYLIRIDPRSSVASPFFDPRPSVFLSLSNRKSKIANLKSDCLFPDGQRIYARAVDLKADTRRSRSDDGSARCHGDGWLDDVLLPVARAG